MWIFIVFTTVNGAQNYGILDHGNSFGKGTLMTTPKSVYQSTEFAEQTRHLIVEP